MPVKHPPKQVKGYLMSKYYREFKKMLFLGSSAPESSEGRILQLQRILRDCLEEIGGLQQSLRSCSGQAHEEYEIEQKQGREKVENMVRDIAMALTGKEIKFSIEADEDFECDEIEDDDFDLDEAATETVTQRDVLDAIDKVLNEPVVQQGLPRKH